MMARKQKTEWVGRCVVCGTVIETRTYAGFVEKLKRHTEKCLKKAME